MTLRLATRAMPPPAPASRRGHAPRASRRHAIVILASRPCTTCVKGRFGFKRFSIHQNIPHDFQAEPKSAPASKTAPQPKGTAALKSLPDFSNPQYLASAGEAEITADIKAKAQELNNNPVQIYEWVRNNVEWQPTWGGQQTADMTLDVKRGNAIDTASLLIALLRSAGIPARYVYGTVEIPIAQAMNWVGGAKTDDATQQILGQGGVPNVALTSGGRTVTMRIEHVWVEALIQYNPGRGAKHIQGQSIPDTWVPMDASFKQYTFTQGMDLQTAVPLDATALINAAQQGATVNEAEGWVQNLNSAAVQSQLNAYQTRLKNYVSSQNGGNSTVGDVLGTRQAQIDPLPYFAGTLPYTLRARSQQFSEVPDSLRAKFRYAIYPDQRSAAWGDGEILSYQAPTASLAGKKLTLSWVAPNEATQKAIEALIPTPPPGQELDRLTDNAWSSTNRPPCTPLLHNQPPNSPAGRCSRRWRSWLATAWACRR